jgi:phosphoribosylaminoimidazolecarboxamide formyltransferase/IMP cyclohydrolase
MAQFRNALISVSDKNGLVDFLKLLNETRMVSTGGTARALREAGLAITDVAEQTGSPEVMDGRVKTLHPRVHVPLLARPDHAGDDAVLSDLDLAPFDLVVVNLYPFERTLAAHGRFDDLIENIDIGGPTLLRAAAKNFARVTVIVDPADYARVAAMDKVDADERRKLAAKAFAHVSSYDAMIAHALGGATLDRHFALGGTLERGLRYGENPHQTAAWYRRRGARTGWQDARVLQGKELSYNNLLDLDAAAALVRDLDGPSAVAVKHTNPCGVATDADPLASVNKCLEADPVSVFGGIVAVNFTVTLAVAERLSKIFLECVVAPAFDEDALRFLAAKKNLRVLAWGDLGLRDEFPRVRSIEGGFLVQAPDRVHTWDPAWRIVGEHPSPAVRADLSFAWAVAAHLKSNAIAVVRDKQTLGLGMGQVNRVDAVGQALGRAKEFHAGKDGLVLASDAFFPFADSIEVAGQNGVRWIIQPGGSVRDAEVLAKARELGVNVVLTGVRHFRH